MTIANPREFLVLAVAKMVPPGEGQPYARDAKGKPVPVVGVDLYEILAFDFTPDGLPEPISVVGKPRYQTGDTYAIFDRRDKSYTLLSGERIGDYKAFSAYVEKRAAEVALWVGEFAAAGTDGHSQHANGADPTPGSGEAGSAPVGARIGGLAGMNTPPSRWR